MAIAIIGLGKMGYNMAARLLRAKKEVVVYNRSPDKTKELAKKGAKPAFTYGEVIEKLGKSPIVWLMIPQAAVDEELDKILPLLGKGDIVVDGGNSNFNKSVERAKKLEEKGINYVDVGVSGGLGGAQNGYCMMVGGDAGAFKRVEPYIIAMCQKDGYAYVGPSGAGHYVKMVHNAIEYGMMEAMGEGFELLESGPYNKLDLYQIAKLWNHGSIVRSYLMETVESGLGKHPGLKGVPGFINDTGEGMWAVEVALKHKVPFTVNTQALYSRYRSRKKETTANKIVAVMRDEFGGHGFGKK